MVGEGDYAAFKAKVTKASLNLKGNIATFVAADGRKLALEHSSERQPKVWRNGNLHDWKTHWPLFQPVDGSKVPCYLGWKERVMHVEAGGHVFDAKLSEDGTYTYSSKIAK